MSRNKKSTKEESHPITMAEWCDNVDLLKGSPEYFGIPDSLVTHIQMSEYNATICINDETGEEDDILILEIAIVTNLGSVFSKGRLALTSKLTKDIMLSQMKSIVKNLVLESGFDEYRVPDGSWITDEIATNMYASIKNEKSN